MVRVLMETREQMSRSQRNRRRRGRGRPRNKALLAMMVVLVLVALAGLSAVGYVISIASSAPPLDSLKPRELGSQSEVRAADGTRLGFIQSNELRQPVAGAKIPKYLKDATVAIEDERFYHHKGVDYAGVVRAAVKNLSSHKTVQGGSTITMQLIRNLYISKERTYQRKIREAKLAEELENEHPGVQGKGWILDKYLNTVPYGTLGGQTAVGVQAASRAYFGKPVAEAQAQPGGAAGRAAAGADHLLAGARAREGRGPPQRGAGQDGRARDDQPGRPRVKTMKKGLGLHVSRYFTSRRESFFFDFVKDELIKELGAKTVRQGGLRVDTTIDLKKQQAARAVDQRPPRRHRAVERDRHDRPEERLHQGDGVVGRLRQVEVQPRRPGPPPARLDVQGDGADDRAAQGRGPALDDATSRSRSSSPIRSGARSTSRPTGTTTTARSASSRRRCTPTTRSTSSSRSTSARRRSSRPPTTWASRRTSTATRRSRSAA